MNVKEQFPKLYKTLSETYGQKPAEEMILGISSSPLEDILDYESPSQSFIFADSKQGLYFWCNVIDLLKSVPKAEHWNRVCPLLFKSLSKNYGVDSALRLLGGIISDTTFFADNPKPILCFTFSKTRQGYDLWGKINEEIVLKMKNPTSPEISEESMNKAIDEIVKKLKKGNRKEVPELLNIEIDKIAANSISKIASLIDSSKSELFATKDSVGEACDYAYSLMPKENKGAMVIAINVYHNTLVDKILSVIK
jgi:hypothetical protein